MDYVLSRPIYTYPYTINLMYYDGMVLLAKNSFSHEKSEMLWEKAEVSLTKRITKCHDDLM